MPPKKARSIPLASVAHAVDSAVEIAKERHDLAIHQGTRVHNLAVFGRYVDGTDLHAAYNFAKDIAQGVKVPGMKVEPVVIKVGETTVAGVIDRDKSPRAP